MARIIDPISGPKRRAADFQDFMAVVLIGYGENLHPFNEGPNVMSKAMLPVGNVPIINYVLDWIFEAGIMAPPSFYASLSEHLSETYSDVSHPKARISIKKHTDGENDGESSSSSSSSQAGTARLLKRFRQYIKNDFILLPCDVQLPKAFKLQSILDRHRSRPEAALTAVMYEPAEPVRESEEKVLIGTCDDDLVLIQPLDGLEEDLEIRTELLHSYPTISLSTRLLDAHIYICRRTILDLISSRSSRDLDSMKEQVIPWIVKGGWQKGLNRKWREELQYKDPFAVALARSTTAPAVTEYLEIDDEKIPQIPWKCQVIIIKPIEPAANSKDQPEHLIRANSLAGYWELNRRILRNMPPQSKPSGEGISSTAQVSNDSMLGEGVRINDKASIKKCIIGRHCNIGKGAKLTGCVLWDFVTVEENARVENSILCSNVRIGEKAQIKDCEFGTGYEAKMGAILKGERLVAGQDA